MVRTRAVSSIRLQWGPTLSGSGSIGLNSNERRCGGVESYEKFHMNALEICILGGKRDSLAEVRKMIHNVIDGA